MNKTKEIKALTGLRGLAALWVVIFHMNTAQSILLTLGLGDYEFIKTIVRRGYLAVDIFFVLSGFILALVYKKLYNNGWTFKGYCAFLWRRIARIYPLYLLMLVIASVFIWQGWFEHPVEGGGDAAFAANAFMIQSFIGVDSIINPSWTLNVDMVAYFLFPAAIWLMLSTRLSIAAAICIGILIAFPIMQYAYRDLADGRLIISFIPQVSIPLSLARCLFELCLGIFAYRAIKENLAITDRFNNATGIIMVLAIIPLLAIRGTDPIIVAIIPFFLIQLTITNCKVTQFFSSKYMLFLGHLSYAIYLCHEMLLPMRTRVAEYAEEFITSDSIADILGIVATLIVIGLFSWVAHTFFEKPVQRRLR